MSFFAPGPIVSAEGTSFASANNQSKINASSGDNGRKERSGDESAKQQLDDETPLEKKVEDLYELIDNIKIAMLTTVRQDGSLVSRAMWTVPEHREGGLYFFTNDDAHKSDEILANDNVNLAYQKDGTGEYVSVSGKAKLLNDRALIKKLYTSSLKAWFSDLGDGVRDGSENDPRIRLLRVDPVSVHYDVKTAGALTRKFKIMKGSVTGEVPHTHAKREIHAEDMARLRALKTEE